MLQGRGQVQSDGSRMGLLVKVLRSTRRCASQDAIERGFFLRERHRQLQPFRDLDSEPVVAAGPARTWVEDRDELPEAGSLRQAHGPRDDGVVHPVAEVTTHLVRDPGELLGVAGSRTVADGIHAWNPVFDVTPAQLIDAIVTEKGVVERPTADSMRAMFP